MVSRFDRVGGTVVVDLSDWELETILAGLQMLRIVRKDSANKGIFYDYPGDASEELTRLELRLEDKASSLRLEPSSP